MHFDGISLEETVPRDAGWVESYFKPLCFFQPPHLSANGLACTDPHVPQRLLVPRKPRVWERGCPRANLLSPYSIYFDLFLPAASSVTSEEGRRASRENSLPRGRRAKKRRPCKFSGSGIGFAPLCGLTLLSAGFNGSYPDGKQGTREV